MPSYPLRIPNKGAIIGGAGVVLSGCPGTIIELPITDKIWVAAKIDQLRIHGRREHHRPAGQHRVLAQYHGSVIRLAPPCGDAGGVDVNRLARARQVPAGTQIQGRVEVDGVSAALAVEGNTC